MARNDPSICESRGVEQAVKHMLTECSKFKSSRNKHPTTSPPIKYRHYKLPKWNRVIQLNIRTNFNEKNSCDYNVN